MKKFFIILSLALSPLLASAQGWDVPLPDDKIAYASLFAGNFSLLLSILMGIIASFLVWRSARKLGGGLFGHVLNYMCVGMLLVVLGTMATVFSPWFEDFWINTFSIVCFATGYILFVIGANGLLKGIMNT